MDVFSLLKFWRFPAGSGSGGGGGVHVQAHVHPTAAGELESSIDEEESFFDFVFANTGDEKDYSCVASPDLKGIDADNDEDDDDVDDVDVDDDDLIRSKSSFRFSSRTKIFSLNSPKTTKLPQSPLRLLKLGFQKDQKVQNYQTKQNSKLEKKETEEEIRIGAMLTRDNSLRHQLRTEKLLENNDLTPSKRFSKEVVNKYLNLMKPTYVKDYSKRSNEKSRLSEKPAVTTPSSSPASSVFSPRKEEKRGGRGAVFRDVRKHLGKSRSASAILQTIPKKKNDDSVVEQQDGIQSAILHCKRSFNSPSQGYVLSRSESDPSNNKPWNSSEEENRSSI